MNPPATPDTAGPIDRIAPTRRPPGRSVMRQNWRKLLFLHWEVDPAQLRPLVPASLDLDLFEGKAYLGLVPFTMTGVRPVWAPAVPGLSNFHETNVRTYVHHRGRDPGVWFLSLDAANAIAVRLARASWHLPYHYARMQLEAGEGDQPKLSYDSERLWPGPVPARASIRAEATGTPFAAEPGTLEHFLAERYILYAQKNDRLCSGRVHHTPYPLQTAQVDRCDESLIATAGLSRPDTELLAHYAEGVSVHVFPLKPVEPG